jgi:hypothetical protein
MKRPAFAAVPLLSLVMALLGTLPGGTGVNAQEWGGQGGEPNRPTTVLSPRPPGQDLKGANGPDGVAAGSVSAASALKWFSTPGVAFVPNSNALTWDYGGSGCLSPGTVGQWRVGVNIPDGSVLKYVYFGYHNVAGSLPSTAYLYRFTDTGSAVILHQVTSLPGSTVTGYNHVGGVVPDHTFDSMHNSYAFAWSGSTTQELCYMQIGYTPLSIFTDASIAAGTTTVKRVHVTELRQAIDALRTQYALSPATWTDPIVAGTTVISAVHLTELRAALSQVYTASGQAEPAYTHPILTEGSTVITAVDVEELRAHILAVR